MNGVFEQGGINEGLPYCKYPASWAKQSPIIYLEELLVFTYRSTVKTAG